MDAFNDSGYVAAIFGIVIFSIIVSLAGYVLASFFMMKIFEKAGVQGKWRAWVPVYNMMVFFKLGDLSPWLVLYGFAGSVLLSFIGIGVVFALAFAVFSAIAAWRIGLKLQKDAVWVILYIFLNPIWFGINAFDKSRWSPNIQPASWASNGFLGDRTVWDGVPARPAAAASQSGIPPQGYVPPTQPGYAPPAPQGYTPPAQPGYAPPAGSAAPATGAAVPPVPPVPPAPPAAPQADPNDHTQPPA